MCSKKLGLHGKGKASNANKVPNSNAKRVPTKRVRKTPVKQKQAEKLSAAEYFFLMIEDILH